MDLRNVRSTGADLGGGCRGVRTPLPPWDDLRFSNTTGILQKKKTMWFIGVEVEQETSAPPPKQNPGSAPDQLDWYKMNIQYHYVLGRFSWCSYHWQILPIYTDHSGELIWKSCGNSLYIRVGSTSGGHIPLPEKYAVIMMNKNRDFEKATFFILF